MAIVALRRYISIFTAYSHCLKHQSTRRCANHVQLDNDTPSTPVKYRVKRCIYPIYISTKIPASIVSICVHPNGIYWARMNKFSNLTHWNYEELGKYMYYKYDHSAHLKKLWPVLHGIPAGEVYILEDTHSILSTRPVNWTSINLIRLDTMLTFYLNLRHHVGVVGGAASSSSVQGDIIEDATDELYEHDDYPESTQPQGPIIPSVPLQKVHKMKTMHLARYFDLLVGKEKVSGLKLCRSIMDGTREESNIIVLQELRRTFNNHKPSVQEQLSNVLLQATMFYELLHKEENDDSH